MGSTDYGIQTLGFDYNQSATAKGFNGVYYKTIPTGIYSGFTLTRVSDTSVTVSSGLCVIADSTNSTITKVSTASSVSITVSSSTPYIIFRFSWSDTANNYMDMEAVAYDSIEDDDLIIGRCIYNDAGTVLQTVFDYNRRSTVFASKLQTQNNYFRVYQTEPASNKVLITGGVINTSSGNITVSGGSFPSSGFTSTTNGRIDLIYINEDGEIEVLEGTDASSPVAPRYANRKVIAEIKRGASETTVKGNEITRVISSFDSNPITSDLLLTDSGGYYTSTDVEDALQELAGSDFSFSGTKTFNNIIISGKADNVSETITGASGQNIQVIKKYGGTTTQYIDQNGKLYNTIGISLAFSDTYSKYTTDEVGSALNQIAGGSMTIAGPKIFSTLPVLGTSTIGSGIIPIYNSAGTLTASTSTVGAVGTPLYLNAGTLTACTVDTSSASSSSNLITSGAVYTALTNGTVTKVGTATIGSPVTPVYVNSGTITALSTTVGGTANPVYVNAGVLTASSSTIGSGTKPIYMSGGILTASSSTVGSSGTPVYLNSGSITACSVDTTPTSGSVNTVTSGGVYLQTHYMQKFTYVVDSNSALSIWASATSGYDFSSVLIKTGTWTLSSGGVDLTASSTKLVVGEAGSSLVFSSSSYGIEYSTIFYPSYTDCSMSNVNISVSTASTSTSPSGFVNCVNLINCHCDVYNSGTDLGDLNCFKSCNKLKNCTGQAHATNSLVGYVFNSCTYLEGCTATIDSATASTLHGFANCSFVTNCTAPGTGTLTGSTPNYMYGFTACTYVTNSACTITTTKGSGGFSNCAEVTNCMTQITSTYPDADVSGFDNCTNVMNCKSTVSGAGNSHVDSGFAACTRLTNCGGSATNSGTDGTGYGFYYCYGMLENYPSGTTTTSAYSNCYATSDIESSYAVAHTPAGGFNRLTT